LLSLFYSFSCCCCCGFFFYVFGFYSIALSHSGYTAKFEPKSFEVGMQLTWNALTMCTASWFEMTVGQDTILLLFIFPLVFPF
jgi:hypothetical protein